MKKTIFYIFVMVIAVSLVTLGRLSGGGHAASIGTAPVPSSLNSGVRDQPGGDARSANSSTTGPERARAAASMDPGPRGDLERSSSGSLCKSNAGDSVTEPHSQSELDALLSGYMSRCPYKLLSALDEIYNQEERDEAWASKVEERIELTARSAGMRVKGGCHSSLCRFDFETAAETCSRLGHEFDRPLTDSLKDTEFQVSIIYRPTGTGCTRYIYSTVMPPAFLAPLRQRMTGGP